MRKLDLDPLAPLEFIVSVIGGLLLLTVLLFVPLVAFGSGSFAGIGDPEVCVSAPQSAVGSMEGGGNGFGGGRLRVSNVPVGARATPDRFNVCTRTPSGAQRALGVFTTLPTFVFAVAFVLVVRRLIRRLRTENLFTSSVALAVGRLGVFLLIGEIVVKGVESLASWRLVDSILDGGNPSFWEPLAFLHVSLAILIAGFGVLTMGRVMAMTVPLQAEIDATV